MTFMYSDAFTIDQAWEAADEIMCPYKNLEPEETDAN